MFTKHQSLVQHNNLVMISWGTCQPRGRTWQDLTRLMSSWVIKWNEYMNRKIEQARCSAVLNAFNRRLAWTFHITDHLSGEEVIHVAFALTWLTLYMPNFGSITIANHTHSSFYFTGKVKRNRREEFSLLRRILAIKKWRGYLSQS